MNAIKYVLKKPFYILNGAFIMIKKHRLYFLLPICIMLTLIALLVYHVGPAIIVSFIYAGM